jgi:hypothetical protein
MSFSPKKYFVHSWRSCPIEGSIFLCLQIIFLSTSFDENVMKLQFFQFSKSRKDLDISRGSNFEVAVEEVNLCRKASSYGQTGNSSCHSFLLGKREDLFMYFSLAKSVRSDLSIRKSSLKKFDCDIVVLKIRRMKRKIFEVEDNVLQQ